MYDTKYLTSLYRSLIIKTWFLFSWFWERSNNEPGLELELRGSLFCFFEDDNGYWTEFDRSNRGTEPFCWWCLRSMTAARACCRIRSSFMTSFFAAAEDDDKDLNAVFILWPLDSIKDNGFWDHLEAFSLRALQPKHVNEFPMWLG